MNSKKIPDPPKEDMFENLDTCSFAECTGLITVPPEDEDELENYMDIYDFGPPIYPKND